MFEGTESFKDNHRHQGKQKIQTNGAVLKFRGAILR